MTLNMKNLLSIFLFFTVISFTFNVPQVSAQTSQSVEKKTTYKKARALQTSTAKRILKIVEALEEVDDEGKEAPDVERALEILNELYERKDSLKSYDRSVMWQYFGYIYLEREDYAKAKDAYEKLLVEPESTIPYRVAALFTLATLNFVDGNYQEGVNQLLQWMEEVETITAQGWYLLAQGYYQLAEDKKTQSEKFDMFEKSIDSMLNAMETAELEGYKPKEGWYTLLAALYSELKPRIGEQVALIKQQEIYEILVNLYPKKEYFIALGGIYAQQKRELDYMITLKAAYQKDFLNKESEYVALTQLLLLNKNPYWAAKVLESGRTKQVLTVVKEKNSRGAEVEKEVMLPVVKDTEKNLKLLADAWRMAQEIDRAIPVLEQAAKLSKDGQTFIILGSLYLSVDKLEQAVDSFKNGLEKGKLANISQARMALGQTYFELQRFEEAKKEFRIAARDEDKKIKQTANNWIKYTENEEIRVKNIALRRDYIQNQG